MKSKHAVDHSLTWAQIDRKALVHNIRAIKRLAKEKGILAIIKADAYGHGMVETAECLVHEKVNYFGVSDVREGIRLRKAGIKAPILLLENTLPSMASLVVDHRLTATVCNKELAFVLHQEAKRKRRRVPIHIKIDTGMGRFGIWHTEAYEFIQMLRPLKGLDIEGIYTHFPSADTDLIFTQHQIDLFERIILYLRSDDLRISYIHAGNSASLSGYRDRVLNLVRPGIMLYGLYPHERLRSLISLKPAMRVHSQVIFLKTIEKGRSISYGRTFVAKRRMKVATVPLGYADGYFRSISGKGAVLIDGQRCPILGRVTMDQVVADVTKVKNLRLGSSVVILGKQKNNALLADDLAEWAGTINYEVTCSLGNRIERKYV